MPSDDTIKLLKECNSGTKMAVKSLKDVVDRVENKDMRDIIEESIKEHEKIGDKTHEKLMEFGDTEKDPSAMAEAMSWLKVNVKFALDSTDSEIASLMIDGCNMGIKSVSKYLNKYPDADPDIQKMVEDLVKLEQKLMDQLRVYLS